jgi:hypothetical protein
MRRNASYIFNPFQELELLVKQMYEDIQNKKHNTLCVGTPLYARLKKKTYKAKSTTHILDCPFGFSNFYITRDRLKRNFLP